MSTGADVRSGGGPGDAGRLEAGTLVIGDLHLDPGGDERVERFVAWLARTRAPRLIILGDLFEVWVGPSQARLAGAATVLGGLSAWTAGGAGLDVVPGNRDFLLGPVFCQLTGARLFPEGFTAHAPARPGTGPFDAEPILFVHGDELCTRDHAYQRMKRVLRSAPVRVLAKRAPLRLARWAAGRLRVASTRAVARKPGPEKAMQEDACRDLAARCGAGALVCGHAHEFRDEQLEGGPRWIVLDAWGGARDVLEIGPGGALEARASGVEADSEPGEVPA